MMLVYLVIMQVCNNPFFSFSFQYPAGMSQLILNFFSFLLGRLERPLLHHVSIHQPVLVTLFCLKCSIRSLLQYCM